MAIEIVDFPMKNGGSFHSFLYVYQRVLLVTQANSLLGKFLLDAPRPPFFVVAV